MKEQIMADALVEISELNKKYVLSGGFLSPQKRIVHAVNDVDLQIFRGETLGVVGESGCGKSTLARLMTRLEKPTGGSISFKGENIYDYTKEALKSYRRSVQIIFQDTYSSLNPRKSALSMIQEPLTIHRLGSAREREERALEIMGRVGLKKEHANRYPHEFSGGQRQRIGIARAIVLRPELIICDEPISALDVSIQAQIVNLLSDFQKELKLSYLFIAHDLSMVRYVSDEVGVMYLGKLVERCTADEIYRRPLHPYTEGLLASIPIPDPRRRTLETSPGIQGDLPNPINLPEGCRFRNRCPKAMELCRSVEPVLQEVSPNHQVACHLYGACQTGTTPEE